MSDIGAFIGAIVVLVLTGVLVSLMTLAPPIRRRCQHNRAARMAAACTLGLVSFAISFGLLTRLGAEAIYLIGTMITVDTFDPEIGAEVTWSPETQMNKRYVVRELWTRLLIPPAMRRPCYAKEAWICEFADDLMPVESGQRGWAPYLQTVGMACVSVVASSVLVWRFTRSKVPPTGAA